MRVSNLRADLFFSSVSDRHRGRSTEDNHNLRVAREVPKTRIGSESDSMSPTLKSKKAAKN